MARPARRRIRFLFALLLASLPLFACNTGLDLHDNTVNVTYRFEGTCTGDVMYVGRNGRTHQELAVASGWSYKFEADSNDYLLLTATNNCAVGTIGVKIFRDGKLYKSETSSGAYVTVRAAGEA